MKFRLLRCFAVAFVCVIETCGFSVWAQDTAVCDAGQYLDGEECKDCPIDDVIGEDKLYQFGDSGIGIESCTVKLNLAKSNCAEGTNVVYKYGSDGYTLDSSNNYSVNPKKGFYGNGTSGLNDHCTACPTNAAIGEDKLYQFGDSGTGIESCNVKLNLAKSNCAEGTNVFYKYVFRARTYVLYNNNDYLVKPKKGFYGNNTSGLNDHCTACPTNAAIGEDKLYQFGDSGIGIESCNVKLNLAKSNCAEGTNVVYKYGSGGYTLDSDNYNIIPDDNNSILAGISATEMIDHCVYCDLNNGYYYVGDGTCGKCPTDEENIGEGKRFQFFKKEGVNCAIKLNPDKDNCDSSTNVVYESDGAGSAYLRKEANVVPKTTSVISDPLPAVDNISSPFCKKCTGEEKYIVDGACSDCKEAGYYLNGDVCKKCPAGYYCPGKTEDDDTSQKAILCPANTYSDEEAKRECSECTEGYSTEWSTLVNKGLQTECSDVSEGFGIGCRSSKVCILSVMSKLSLAKNPSGFTFGSNIKIETLNQSVVQSIENNN